LARSAAIEPDANGSRSIAMILQEVDRVLERPERLASCADRVYVALDICQARTYRVNLPPAMVAIPREVTNHVSGTDPFLIEQRDVPDTGSEQYVGSERSDGPASDHGDLCRRQLRGEPVSAENRVTSCDLHVFV
jgi:hypothetical protein